MNPPETKPDDPRGWQVARASDSCRNATPWLAYRYHGGKPYQRRFRDEASARGFAAACNSAPKPDPSEEPLRAVEIRARFHLSLDQLKTLKEDGLPFVAFTPKDHRFYPSEIVDFLNAERGDGVFKVEPLNGHPRYKFRVRGSGEFSKEQRYFGTRQEAESFARMRNRDVQKRGEALPRRVRGMEEDAPFYRVAPYHCDARPDLGYEVSWYEVGKPRAIYKRFRTEGEALHFANVKNLEAAKAFAALETPQPSPGERRLPPMPPASAWTPGQLAGFDSGHHRNPMKGPPYRIHATTHKGYSFVVRGPVINGKQERSYFKKESQAKTFAHMRNTEAQAQGFESIGFPSWLRVMAQRGQQQLEAHGKCLAAC